MDHMVWDWERADHQNLGTYKRFMRLTMVSTVALLVLLVLMAAFLV